jgi:hypothetical protein
LGLIKAQNIDAVVAGSDLKVSIVSAMPLIVVLGHLDLSTAEEKSPKFFDPLFINIGINVNLHGVLSHQIDFGRSQPRYPRTVSPTTTATDRGRKPLMRARRHGGIT